MSQQRKIVRRGARLLLAGHIFFYVIMWVLALYSVVTRPVIDSGFTAAVMLWLPVLALHVVVHLASERTGASVDSERRAYREGFADGMRQIADRQGAIGRLSLNDEGELFEMIEKPKRERL